MTAAAITATPTALAPPDPIAVYRDDGPLARALGALLGRTLRLPGAALILAGMLPLLAAVAIGGGDTSRLVAAAVLAWVLVTAGASSNARPRPKIRWAELPLLRATEYRLRHRGVMPAPWVSALSGGWDGRLVLAFLLLVAGALPAGYYVAAAVLGAVFVGEAAYAWFAVGRVQRPLEYEDEEDEGQ